MKFVIFGAGGVGGFFGGKLAAAGSDVWFVARGNHLEAMRNHGLRINSTDGSWVVAPGKMTDDPGDIGPADVLLFCVKSYDTESAARRLDPLLTPETIVISLQNGIDNEERIESIIPAGVVYGGVANIYSTITAPGIITEAGGPKKLMFGPLRKENEPLARAILSELSSAGINAEHSTDIRLALWKKFVFITAVGGLTALTRLSLGEILRSQETRELLGEAMRETLAISRTQGIDIEPAFVDSVFDTLAKFDNETRSSLYYDLSHGKPLEIDALSGTVVRFGLSAGVPTPIHRTIYASLIPHHRKHSHARNQKN